MRRCKLCGIAVGSEDHYCGACFNSEILNILGPETYDTLAVSQDEKDYNRYMSLMNTREGYAEVVKELGAIPITEIPAWKYNILCNARKHDFDNVVSIFSHRRYRASS